MEDSSRTDFVSFQIPGNSIWTEQEVEVGVVDLLPSALLTVLVSPLTTTTSGGGNNNSSYIAYPNGRLTQRDRAATQLQKAPASSARSISAIKVNTSLNTSYKVARVIDEGFGPPRKRENSFSYLRCMNCNQQFLVSKRSPRNADDGDFCSGECHMSFLAAGIRQQYGSGEEILNYLDSSDEDDVEEV
jgi:hypothetical protein